MGGLMMSNEGVAARISAMIGNVYLMTSFGGVAALAACVKGIFEVSVNPLMRAVISSDTLPADGEASRVL